MKKTILALTAAAIALGGTAYAQNTTAAKQDWATKTVTRTEAQAKAAEMFTKMDANKDGKLDQADREAHRAERKQAMFATLDTDKNGAISRDEFNAERGPRAGGEKGEGKGGHRMGKRHGGGHGGMGMMMGQMADTNKDGAVSRAEFLAAHEAHFAKVDANKDGKITPDERKAAMAQMRQHMGKMGGMRGGPDGPPPPPAN